MISADSLYAREEIVLCVYTVPYNPGSGAGAGNEGFRASIPTTTVGLIYYLT